MVISIIFFVFFLIGSIISLIFSYSKSFFEAVSRTHGEKHALWARKILRSGGYVTLLLAFCWLIIIYFDAQR